MLKKITLISVASFILLSTTALAGKGGRINIYSQEEPENLNPLFQNSESSKSAYNLLYSGLLRVDENFDYYTDLAVSIPTRENKGVVFNDEGMVVTYKLKELSFWHDGKPVTSDDIMFTWKCYINPDIPKLNNEETQAYSKIYKIETPDEKTVKIYFKEDYSKYKDLFKYILPKHGFDPKSVLKIQQNHPFNIAPIGSGPFKFVDWKKGKYLILDSYDKYYTNKPNSDQITYFYGDLDKNMTKEIENGKIHLVQTKSDEYFESNVKQHLMKSKKYAIPTTMMEELAFNTEGVFKDLNLRKAIAFSIDRERITDKFLDLESAWSDAHPNSSIYDSTLKNEYFYDLKMSKYYLDNSGWIIDEKDGLRKKSGKILTINLLTGQNKAQTEFIKYMTEVSKYLGIKINLKQSYQIEDEMKNKNSYDMVVYTKSPNINGLDRMGYFGSKNMLPKGKNYSRFVSYPMDDIFYSPFTVNILKEQREVTKILKENIPILPLFTYTKNVAISASLQNFKPNSSAGSTWNSIEWWTN
ncbi:MAG: ABC transporter substrate-binding protein [Cyanobacteriota bacterium]